MVISGIAAPMGLAGGMTSTSSSKGRALVKAALSWFIARMAHKGMIGTNTVSLKRA